MYYRCSTTFSFFITFVLLNSMSYALTTEQNTTIYLIANNINASNTTFESIFNSYDSNMTQIHGSILTLQSGIGSLFTTMSMLNGSTIIINYTTVFNRTTFDDNLTILNGRIDSLDNKKYDKIYIDNAFMAINYNITTIPAIVDNSVLNAISRWNHLDAENLTKIARNITDRIDFELSSRMQSLESNYVTKEDAKQLISNSEMNMTSRFNDKMYELQKTTSDNYNTNIFFIVLCSLFVAIFLWWYSNNRLIIKTPKGLHITVVDEDHKIGVMEEVMTSKEYKDLNNKNMELMVKTYDSRMTQTEKEKMIKYIEQNLIRNNEDWLKYSKGVHASEEIMTYQKKQEEKSFLNKLSNKVRRKK